MTVGQRKYCIASMKRDTSTFTCNGISLGTQPSHSMWVSSRAVVGARSWWRRVSNQRCVEEAQPMSLALQTTRAFRPLL
eukprot:4034670-Pyramimonas_sp.AAC.1